MSLLLTAVDVASAPPGVYEVASGTEAYFPAMGLLELGEAEYLGEAYESGARVVKLALASAGRALSGPEERRTITIGAQFFATALKDYNNWPLKWWREAVQNSVDAGALHILLGVDANPDGTFTVYADDDGRGMSAETLIEKFLVLGASTKVGAQGISGGFGKAKELLLLPWISWRIHTLNTIAEGAGIDYSVAEAPYRKGTRLEVVMPPDNTTTAAAAIEFLSRCYLPNVRCLVDGKHVKADLHSDHIIAQGPGVAIYHVEGKERQPYCYVRTNGLFMFQRYVGEVPGFVLAELLGPSIGILTANRDGFVSWETGETIDKLARKLAKDNVSALNKKAGLIRQKFKGKGRFRAKKAAGAALEQVGSTQTALSSADIDRISTVMTRIRGGGPPAPAVPATPSEQRALVALQQAVALAASGGTADDQVVAWARAADAAAQATQYTKTDDAATLWKAVADAAASAEYAAGTGSPKTAATMGTEALTQATAAVAAAGGSAGTATEDGSEILAELGWNPTVAAPPINLVGTYLDQRFRGPNHIEAAIKQLVWEPDFYLKNNIEGWKVPKKFFPETMTPRVLKLAKVWTELCRFVLMQLGSSTPYGVGFIFDRKIMAEADVESDEDAEGDDKLTWLMLNPFRDPRVVSAIYTPSKDDDLRQLYASAIHEATHIADRIDYHDESFAVALTNNFAKCADGWRKIKTIVAGIRMTGSPALVPEDDE